MKIRKLSKLSKVFIGAMLLLALVATSAYAANQPGTVNDPIVTKSYVDEQVRIMKENLRAEVIAEVKASMKMEVDLKFEAFQLNPGQKLIGHNGTEIIVRSGTAKVIAGDNGDGIPDLTGGQDLAGGTVIPTNHHLLIPRTDNRGLVVDEKSTACWVMVRGGYDIK